MTSRTASTLSLISAIQVDDESSVVSLGATSSTPLAWSPNDSSSIASRTSAASSPFSETQVNSINSSASPIPNYISSTESQHNGEASSSDLPTNTSNILSTNLSSGRVRYSNNSRSNAPANHSLESVSLHGHSIDAANRNAGTQGQGSCYHRITGEGNSMSRVDSRDWSRVIDVIAEIASGQDRDELSDGDNSNSRNSIASASEHAQTTDERNVDALSTTEGGLIWKLIL